MYYSRFGIKFHLLKEHGLEMVRQWRNDPVVANNYEFRDHITPEMQRQWFQSVNNIHNLYTIIEYQGEKLGVINIKNIDWEKKTCEGGIFIPYPKFHQSFLPAIVSFITTEIIFMVFDWNVSYAHVLKDNKSVQGFVKMLGYVLMPGQEAVNNQQYAITRASFEKFAPRLKKAISALVNTGEPGIFHVEKDELDDPLILQWETKVNASRHIREVIEDESGKHYVFGT